jgi:hypothetical protein
MAALDPAPPAVRVDEGHQVSSRGVFEGTADALSGRGDQLAAPERAQCWLLL